MRDYIDMSGANQLLSEMVETLMLARPADPAPFMADFISRAKPGRFCASRGDVTVTESSLSFGGLKPAEERRGELERKLKDGLLLSEEEWAELTTTPEERLARMTGRLQQGHLLSDAEKSELRELRKSVLEKKLQEGHLLSDAEKLEVRKLEARKLQTAKRAGGSPTRLRGSTDADDKVAAKLGELMVQHGYTISDLKRGLGVLLTQYG